MSNDESIRLSPDALISLVVIEAQAREQERISQVTQEAPEFIPSLEFQKNMSALLKKFHTKQRRIKIRKRVKSALITAAASVSVFSISMLPYAPVRDAVKETLIVWQEKCTSFFFPYHSDLSLDLALTISSSYTPAGFSIQELVPYDCYGEYYAKYSNLEGAWYDVTVCLAKHKQTIALDNEYSSYYPIEFNGHEAIWAILQDQSNIIFWESSDLLFIVTGNANVTELVKVSESINVTRSTIN